MKKFLAIAIVAAAIISCNEKKTGETTLTTDSSTIVTPTQTAPIVDTSARMMDTTTMLPTDTSRRNK